MTNEEKTITEIITRLNCDCLPSRTFLEGDVVPDLGNAMELNVINNQLQKELSEADIPIEWKKTIQKWAGKNKILLDSAFWNVGDLRRSLMFFMPNHLNNECRVEGLETEVHRYNDLENLYWKITEFHQYYELFSFTDKNEYTQLLISNVGDSFDEDIDVKFILKAGSILNIEKFVFPSDAIIDNILKMGFLNDFYCCETNDMISKYSGYEKESTSITRDFSIEKMLYGVSSFDEYESDKRTYRYELERIFCYQVYAKEDCDILTFHIDYLKHNTSMAFPSVLVFEKVPEKINYEISSKHSPAVVKGEILLCRSQS